MTKTSGYIVTIPFDHIIEHERTSKHLIKIVSILRKNFADYSRMSKFESNGRIEKLMAELKVDGIDI